MARTSTQQKTAPTLTDPAEAALAEGTGSRSASKKKAASKKKFAVKKTAARAATKPARYGRAESLIDALKKGGTRDEITRYSDKLYVRHGNGTSSLKGARAQLDLTLGTRKTADVVEEDADKRLKLTK